MKITIATPDQLSIVKDLAYTIWPTAYGEILSKKQLNFMLDKFYHLDWLKNQMFNHNQVFLLIEENKGYLGFCAYELNCGNSNNTKLHKLYVLPQTQGKGIGKALLSEVEKIALENHNDGVFLNVNRYNKAQEFYKHQGYIISETIDIEIGNGYLMEDFVMKKSLN